MVPNVSPVLGEFTGSNKQQETRLLPDATACWQSGTGHTPAPAGRRARELTQKDRAAQPSIKDLLKLDSEHKPSLKSHVYSE